MYHLFPKHSIIFIIVMAALAGCNRAADTPTARAEAASAAPLVREGRCVRVPDGSPLRQMLRVGTAEEQSLERPIVAPGVIEADPARLIKVTPPVSGRIVQIVQGARRQREKRRGALHPRFHRSGSSLQRRLKGAGSPQPRPEKPGPPKGASTRPAPPPARTSIRRRATTARRRARRRGPACGCHSSGPSRAAETAAGTPSIHRSRAA